MVQENLFINESHYYAKDDLISNETDCNYLLQKHIKINA